jgi:uncharacterized repeat protein (TIGR03803 family)
MKALQAPLVAGIASSLVIACALPAAAAAEKILYSFSGGTDGANPEAGLLDAKGALYGTTAYGGSADCGGSGCGTLFRMTRSGGETVLETFGDDGQEPRSAATRVGQMLYGTTSYGGEVYAFDLKTETGTALGSCPGSEATPVKVGGSLYATSVDGGDYGYGTVFATNLQSGATTVIHSFGNGNDGALPHAGLVAVGDKVYGTTYYGGIGGDGAVFVVDTSDGTESLIASLNNASGENPVSALIQSGDYLYGTTLTGGAHHSGTIFSINIKQPEITQQVKVLHGFGNGLDGQAPAGALVDVGGTLYGTTESGGKFGYGTVFSVDAQTGAEKVLYSFIGGAYGDGAEPEAGLIYVNGVLYGTTYSGGANNLGAVFSIKP